MTDTSQGTATLADKANAAFCQVANKVVELAKHTGTPVVVWEEGHVKELSPDEIPHLTGNAIPTNPYGTSYNAIVESIVVK